MYVAELSRLDPQPEDVFFKDEAGRSLHAWYFSNKNPEKTKATIVFFHGNAQNLTAHFASLYWILEQPYDVFIFDYPGYGQSEAKPSPQSTVESGVATLRWAKQKMPDRPLIVFAQSIGGPIAIKSLEILGEESGVKALVLDSTFMSYQEVGASVLNKMWLTWPFQWLSYLLLSDRWATDRKDLPKLNFLKGVLVIHAEEDPSVDYRLGKKMFDAFAAPKQMWTLSGRGHINGFFRENGKYRSLFVDWLDGQLLTSY